MGLVSYNSKRIIPAPAVTYRKVYDTNEDGLRVGSRFQITVEGTIIPHRGSPNSNGVFYTGGSGPDDEVIGNQNEVLGMILRKQEALRDLLSDEGQSFEVQSDDGSPVLKFNPRIREPITFSRNGPLSWATRCEYSIQLEADIIYVNGTLLGEDDDDITNYHIERFDEQWSIEAGDDIARTYRLSRQLSAKGKRFYDETGTLTQQAWENAQDYVLDRLQLGLDTTKMVASGVLNDSNISAYNYLRSQNVNEAGGTFAVTETWLCFHNPSGYHAIEEFNVNTRIAENGRVTVGLEGNIKGLEVRNNTTRELLSDRWLNASGKFGEVESSFIARAQNISGYSLHQTPLNRTIGRNTIQGTVSYQYEYNNRPSSLINGASSEVINVGYENQADIFAEIPVIGRALGPVLQDIGTRTSKKKNLSIEAIMTASGQTTSFTEPNTDAIVSLYTPDGAQIFRARDTVNFSITQGNYNRQVSWVYE